MQVASFPRDGKREGRLEPPSGSASDHPDLRQREDPGRVGREQRGGPGQHPELRGAHLRRVGSFVQRPSSAPPRRPHLVGFGSFAFRLFTIPGTSAFTPFARARITPGSTAFRRFGRFRAPSFAAAIKNPGPIPGPYSRRTYAASSANCRGLSRSSTIARPTISIILVSSWAPFRGTRGGGCGG